MDEVINAIASFDVERLKELEARIGAVTVKQLALGLRCGDEQLSEVLKKHLVLGQVVDATAANLKVLVSVLRIAHEKLL